MGMKIPPKFKQLTSFIRRAESLDQDPRPDAKVVAFYCRLYATDLGMELNDNSEENFNFLRSLTDRLEADRMPEISREEGRIVCLKYALEQFSKADEEDRAGIADKSTARTFYAAGVFFDTLKHFGELDADIDKQRKYSKWKAAEILKALREGRSPTPGGLGEEVPAVPSTSGNAEMGAREDDMPLHHEDDKKDMPHDALPWLPSEAPGHAIPYAGYEMPAHPPAPAPAPAPAPSIDPPASTVPFIPKAPAPAPAPAPAREATMPTRPFQPGGFQPRPQPSAPGSSPVRPRQGGGHPTPANLSDAIELCRFAISAFEHKDVSLGVQRLQDALSIVTSTP